MSLSTKKASEVRDNLAEALREAADLGMQDERQVLWDALMDALEVLRENSRFPREDTWFGTLYDYLNRVKTEPEEVWGLRTGDVVTIDGVEYRRDA